MSSAIPQFSELLTLSARVGADPMLVQAAGGNTSVKHDGTLWIKASGTWLQNALVSDIMVPVRLQPLLDAIAVSDPEAEKAQSFIIEEQNPGGLRPSIETTLHTSMPQKIVVHVHCIETISIMVRDDYDTLLQGLLADFNWVSVPYARPGLRLSDLIRESIKPDTDVILMGNHGLVVAADSVSEVEALLANVCKALKQPVRTPPSPDIDGLQSLMEGTEYRLPQNKESHGVACDELSLAAVAGGSLYPDHVIFLGQGSIIAAEDESVSDVCARIQGERGTHPISILFPGKGVLMHQEANEAQEAMARCLADVAVRILKNTPLNYLRQIDNDELLNWGAEKYRQNLDKSLTEKKTT